MQLNIYTESMPTVSQKRRLVGGDKDLNCLYLGKKKATFLNKYCNLALSLVLTDSYPIQKY